MEQIDAPVVEGTSEPMPPPPPPTKRRKKIEPKYEEAADPPKAPPIQPPYVEALDKHFWAGLLQTQRTMASAKRSERFTNFQIV